MMFTASFLQKVVDILLPGLPETERLQAIPSASQVGIGQKLAQHVQTAHNRALIADALVAIVQQGGDVAQFVATDEADCILIVEAVERDNSMAFKALLFTVAADYYEETAVLKAFGWRPTPPQPEGYPLPPFNEGLLDGVKSKRKLWRE